MGKTWKQRNEPIITISLAGYTAELYRLEREHGRDLLRTWIYDPGGELVPDKRETGSGAWIEHPWHEREISPLETQGDLVQSVKQKLIGLHKGTLDLRPVTTEADKQDALGGPTAQEKRADERRRMKRELRRAVARRTGKPLEAISEYDIRAEEEARGGIL